jgi:hypothetical protein
VWRTHEGHRKAHRCRDPTAISTADQICCMKPLSPTQKLCVPRHAPYLSGSPPNRSFLPAPTTIAFAALFHRRQFLGRELSRVVLRSAASPHLQTRPFPN